MTKDEAIQELKNGKTLTHRFFSDDEDIKQPRSDIGEYEFEDGVEIFINEWSKDKGYLLEGWSKFE